MVQFSSKNPQERLTLIQLGSGKDTIFHHYFLGLPRHGVSTHLYDKLYPHIPSDIIPLATAKPPQLRLAGDETAILNLIFAKAVEIPPPRFRLKIGQRI